ncbi:hypothetical protein ACFXBB_03725 [Streptomyces scopuliridis]|uniref:RraA family protein n=1 Tax=Streptomyces scopuliridis TaxID=452529 RepID=UPI0036CC930A
MCLAARFNALVECVALGDSAGAAQVGDLIAGLAASNGWEGVIIHGAVRDVEALSEINLGVKALGSRRRRHPHHP